MNGKQVLSGLVMAAAIVLVCSAQSAKKTPEKSAAGQPQKPLIRKDLLQKKTRGTAAIKRDLFSPQSILGNQDMPLVMPKVKTTADEESPAAESQPPLVLHYIGFGYNQTKQKYFAMIFFQEQVTTVQEGDTLGPGWKVVKITAKELQVEGPDGKPLTFSREGDQR
jgi:hypothetical protein